MATDPPREVTQILKDVAAGDREALPDLLSAVYDDLRALAESSLRRERSGHTLQATALVHEVYLKLVDQRKAVWEDRAHFFGAASEVIRRILVDHARARGRAKRGGDRHRLTISAAEAVFARTDVDLVALDDALRDLAAIDPVQSRIVEMRFFGGLKIDEVAAVLDVAKRTVDREWSCARAWLYRHLAVDADDGRVEPERG